MKGGMNKMKHKKILMVEDDVDYLNLFYNTIPRYASMKGQSENISVDIAQDKASALEMITKGNYDVVFTDGCLERGEDDYHSDWSGAEIAKAAKQNGAYTIGISRESEKFKNLAGDLLDINYKKPWRVPVLWHIIENQPNNEEFKKYLRE